MQIVIPVRNNMDLLEKTMDSILNQEYPREFIYTIIMDFGSTDGTYEKALSYEGYHLGVYRTYETFNQRQLVTEMARIAEYTKPEGTFVYYVVMYPGDVLYPQCLLHCAKAIQENQDIMPNMIITEADIRKEDGSIIKQKNLFPTDTLLNGSRDFLSYIERGYCHQIFCLSSTLGINRYRASGEMNEQRWWNKSLRSNMDKQVIYLSEPLAVIQEIFYEDELEEILLRWESIIVQKRFYESRCQKALLPEFEQRAKANLAEYAVWRSFVCYQEDKRKKMTEDCLLIAAVIDKTIIKSIQYKTMEDLLIQGNIEKEQYLKNYYTCNGYS